MTQVKIFSRASMSDRISDLEQEINEWLNYNENKLEVLEIKWHHDNTRVVMIVYKMIKEEIKNNE